VIVASASDPASVLIQYGALGVLAIIALGAVKVLFVRETQAHQREADRADLEHGENVRLNAAMVDRLLPAVTTASNAVTECLAFIRAVSYREDVAAAAQAARDHQ
jgi:hypothetical protein